MSSEYTPLFSKGISTHFGLSYPTWTTRIPQIYHVGTMDARVLDRQGWTAYRFLPETRLPGEAVQLNEFNADYGKRYVVVNYATGDVLPQEDFDDDQYGMLSREIPAKGGALSRLFRVLEETLAANYFSVFGFAPGTSVPGSPDGVALFSTAHPQSRVNASVTVSNRPSTDVDLGAGSLQTAIIALSTQQESSGLEFIDNPPRVLVVNPKQKYIVKQLLKGEWQIDSPNRNQNWIREDNITAVMWPYFRSSGTVGAATDAYNSWFLVGRTHHLNFLRRQKTKIDSDYAVRVLSHIYVAHARFAIGHDSWRGTYGSKGA